MKVAVMQPYFFPYLGYFALLHYADQFVLFDIPQYDRKGWMHRNRVLKPAEGWQYVHADVVKPPYQARIRDVRLREEVDWRAMIFRQLEHYRRFAPYFTETIHFLDQAWSGSPTTLVELNRQAIEAVQRYLGLACLVSVWSEMNLEIAPAEHPGQWALRIAQSLGADEYVNPTGGRDIFVRAEFADADINLSFLEHRLPPYLQGKRPFEAGLSIIDVMMFNSREEARRLVECYDVSVA